MNNRTYVAIDLKSFYASVECIERKLDPMTTNLVVADISRTEKTICLAVSPPLKSYGISGRARLFEVVQKVKEVNAQRQRSAPGHQLTGASSCDTEVKAHPEYALNYLVAPPRMAIYLEWSTRIYNVYLKYIAPEDIHVYSIDEVMMDVTDYLKIYRCNARELAKKIILDVLGSTGITATAGIGSNLYLCKIAMDIMAKRIKPDRHGVRIATLTEMSYRRLLWDHRPLTDFWRVGRGYTNKLEANGLFTMGDIARCSIGTPAEHHNEELLYKLFGVNAELLIDHAWGWEPCTMADIKAYKPSTNSLASGQVLQSPYESAKARLVAHEMADLLVLDLVEKGLVTDQVVLTVGYDVENLSDPNLRRQYHGVVTTDHYGRQVPKHAHGTSNLDGYTSSAKAVTQAVLELYDRIVDPRLLIRRINLTVSHVVEEASVSGNDIPEQLDLFVDYEALRAKEEQEKAELERERRIQTTVLSIKKKYGKNAILKGMNLEDGATAKERNRQIGGHKA